MSNDTQDVHVYYDPDEIPKDVWNYTISVKPGLTVVGSDGQTLGFHDHDSGLRAIVNEDGEQVGELPPGLAHWSGGKADAEALIDQHPSGDCLCLALVLMLVHPEDVYE